MWEVASQTKGTICSLAYLQLAASLNSREQRKSNLILIMNSE